MTGAPRPAQRRSLEGRMRAWLLGSLGCGTLLIAVALVVLVGSELQGALESQVNVVGRALERNLQLSVAAKSGDADNAFEQIEWVRGLGDELVSVVVFGGDGAALVGVAPDGRLAPAALAALRANDTVSDRALQASVQLVIRSDEGLASPAGAKAGAPSSASDDLEAALAAELEAAATEEGASAQEPSGEAGARRGQVRITLSAAPEALRQLSYVGVTGILLCFAAILVLRWLMRDAAQLLGPAFQQAQRMSEGDFTERTDAAFEELAILADAFNSISGSLSSMIADVRRLAAEVSGTVEHVQAESSAIQLGVARELVALKESEAAARAMRESVEASAAKLRELVERVTSSGSDTTRIADTNRDTAAALEALKGELEKHAKSLEVVGRRTKSLFDNAHVLAESSSEARAAATRMMSAIDNATSRAEEAARLANAAMTAGLEGGDAIENAVSRIGDIAAEAGIMQSSLSDLMERMEQMKPVLGAIGDVTASTSLLALNAGILAAQAGEHGRPFHVVVEQLKALSRQTAALTGQVDDAVTTVLEQRGHTAEAAARLNGVVRAAVGDARRAGTALGAIRESTVESREVSVAIAGMVRGQKRDVEETLGRIAQSAGAGAEVEASAKAVVDEARVLDEVRLRFSSVVGQVVTSSRTQGEVAGRVGKVLESVGAQVQTLASAQDRQHGDVKRVSDAISQIRTVAEDARARAAALERVVLGLRESADRLMAGLARFRTPGGSNGRPVKAAPRGAHQEMSERETVA